jgi:microcystin degradation protein MlrC
MTDHELEWIDTIREELGDDLRVAVEHDRTSYVSRYPARP